MGFPRVTVHRFLLSLEYEGRRRRASSLTRFLVSSVKARRAPLILKVSFLLKGPY